MARIMTIANDNSERLNGMYKAVPYGWSKIEHKLLESAYIAIACRLPSNSAVNHQRINYL